MGYLKRTPDDVIAWGDRQVTNPTEDWFNRCQRFCRMAYGVDIWGWDPVTQANSAWGAWKMIPDDEKVKTDKAHLAPRGSLVYYSGGDFGHVTIAVGKTTNDKVLSNDYARRGKIDRVATRDLPRWGLTVVGYSFWTPFGELKPNDPDDFWDGVYPSGEGSQNASDNPDLRNAQAWRWACRMADLGWYDGAPQPRGEQGWPRKAVERYQKARGFKVTGDYGPALYKQIFGISAP